MPTLTAILDKHAPVQSKLISSSKSNPSYTTEHRSDPSAESLAAVRKSSSLYNKALVAAKKSYYSELVLSNLGQPRQLWNTVN